MTSLPSIESKSNRTSSRANAGVLPSLREKRGVLTSRAGFIARIPFSVYLKRAIEALREDGRSIDDSLLSHLSPVGWEHINLTGDYVRHADKRVAKGRFRPMRKPLDSISRLFTANSEA
jgi:hypothetical protein